MSWYRARRSELYLDWDPHADPREQDVSPDLLRQFAAMHDRLKAEAKARADTDTKPQKPGGES